MAPKKKFKIAFMNVSRDYETAPLNMMYLGTYIMKYVPNTEVRIIDCNYEDIFESAKRYKPDMFCFTTYTVKWNLTKKFVRKLKGMFPGVPILAGGVHISANPQSFADKDCYFDIGVISEGEETFEELVNIYLGKGKFSGPDLKKVKGVVYRSKKGLVYTESRPFIQDLDKVPIPNRNLLNSAYFKPKVSINKNWNQDKVVETCLMTSRGCPYDCFFCFAAAFWKKVRFHSVERVIEEIKYLVEDFGVNFIVVYDDMFITHKKRLRQIIDALKEADLLGKIKFAVQFRANEVDDELCKLAKELNVITVNFGFESGSDKILQFLKGPTVDVEKMKKAIIKCQEYGFNVSGSMMFGTPGETKTDMYKSLAFMDFLIQRKVQACWCGVSTPLPMTKMWHYGVKHGYISQDFKDWDLLDPAYIHHPFFIQDYMTQKDFVKIMKQAKRKSMFIDIGRHPTWKRKLVDQVYYNKLLFHLFLNIFLKFKPAIRWKLVNLVGMRGTFINHIDD